MAAEEDVPNYLVAPATGGIGGINGCNYRSTVKVTPFTFIWSIKNFTYVCSATGEKFSSQTFFSPVDNKLEWCLRMNPYGSDHSSTDHVSLYLILIKCNRRAVRARFRFQVLSGDRKMTHLMKSERAFRFTQGRDWGFKKFISRAELFKPEKKFLLNDTLTIICEVTQVGQVSPPNKSPHGHLPDPATDEALYDAYLRMYNERIYPDVVLVCQDGKELMAHRAILTVRSKFLKNRLEDKNFWDDQGRVMISDPDSKVVECLVRFLYGDQDSVPDEMAERLLIMSNKYEIGELKAHCETRLAENLTMDNVAQMFILSHDQDAKQLKDAALNFMENHSAEVQSAEKFREEMIGHAKLLMDAFTRMSTQRFVGLHPGSAKKR